MTDGDGDIDTAFVGIGDKVRFEDDGPVVNASTNIIYANSDNDGAGSIKDGGTGIFDYNIGADEPTYPLGSDFSTIQLSGSVGSNSIFNTSVARVVAGPDAEDGDSARYLVDASAKWVKARLAKPGAWASALGWL